MLGVLAARLVPVKLMAEAVAGVLAAQVVLALPV
jgi:hypothetical protein